MPKYRLVQKQHSSKGQYYVGSGKYFGFEFGQLNDELITTQSEKDIKSLLDAGLVKKVTDAVYNEMVAESKGEEVADDEFE
jgi:hypothetical protein